VTDKSTSDILPAAARVPFSIGLLVAALALGGFMVLAISELDRTPGGLTTHVLAEIERTGVEHPVTAVLLNIRLYDTWLELVVLMLGLLGVLAVRGAASLSGAPVLRRDSGLLDGLTRLLVPLMILVAGYLLWLGKFDAGGAFQAGVVLGVAFVLLWFAGRPSVVRAPEILWKWGVAVGVVGFFLAAIMPLLAGNLLLTLQPPYAGYVIVVIEAMAAIAIGVTVASLIVGLQAA
jgi:multisubunit Na+/H+ antiporter MnhB subunit